MSEPMKIHPTSSAQSKRVLYVLDNETMYAIPKGVAKKYIVDTKKTIIHEENISAGDLFAEFDKKHSKAGALLKGLRAREDLTQVEFAKKIGVSQTNLSKMENGTRNIGKILAKRITLAFDVDYRMFL